MSDPSPDTPSLRGRCRDLAEAACADDPPLTLVRGWYDDPIWGAPEATGPFSVPEDTKPIEETDRG